MMGAYDRLQVCKLVIFLLSKQFLKQIQHQPLSGWQPSLCKNQEQKVI